VIDGLDLSFSIFLFKDIANWKKARDKCSLYKISGVNFINILRMPFLYESTLHSFSLITVWLWFFWWKNIGAKAAHKCWWNWLPGSQPLEGAWMWVALYHKFYVITYEHFVFSFRHQKIFVSSKILTYIMSLSHYCFLEERWVHKIGGRQKETLRRMLIRIWRQGLNYQSKLTLFLKNRKYRPLFNSIFFFASTFLSRSNIFFQKESF